MFACGRLVESDWECVGGIENGLRANDGFQALMRRDDVELQSRLWWERMRSLYIITDFVVFHFEASHAYEHSNLALEKSKHRNVIFSIRFA